MKLHIWFTSLPMLLCCASVLAASAGLSPSDEAAAFKAAGFKLKGKQWRACDDPGTSSRQARFRKYATLMETVVPRW
jgi:hypothetical protein